MASRLANLSQASEAKQNQPSEAKSVPLPPAAPKRKKTYPAFNNPSYKYGNPLSMIIGTCGE